MKYLFYILALQILSVSSLVASPAGCFSTMELSCVINQKIDAHHVAGFCKMGLQPFRVLIKVKRDYRAGGLQTAIKQVGSQTMTLSNGFSELVETWQECGPNEPRKSFLPPDLDKPTPEEEAERYWELWRKVHTPERPIKYAD